MQIRGICCDHAPQQTEKKKLASFCMVGIACNFLGNLLNHLSKSNYFILNKIDMTFIGWFS